MIKIECKTSRYYIITTVILLSLILYLMVYSLRGILFDHSNRLLHILVFTLLVFTVTYGVFYRPRSIILHGKHLYIKFLFWKKKIEYINISDIKVISNNKMDIRMLGISGLFGKIGLFYSRALKQKYKSYVTDKKKTFYIFEKKVIY